MKIFPLLFIIISLFLTSCSFIPPEKRCSLDTDCVPAACCHAKDAVNKESAPNCQGILCTAVCEPGTLDCGQGKIKCLNKQCTVVIKP